ncbi:hypothetical protein HAX54_052798 [Datura stramonium]|uniref:Uncharacterized protein n=1 Tax=Datura stramonium TaxID=4076 RepID=A0ABS8WRI1_DATST|nr:hypothetical protein [Datura stramonium]
MTSSREGIKRPSAGHTTRKSRENHKTSLTNPRKSRCGSYCDKVKDRFNPDSARSRLNAVACSATGFSTAASIDNDLLATNQELFCKETK